MDKPHQLFQSNEAISPHSLQERNGHLDKNVFRTQFETGIENTSGFKAFQSAEGFHKNLLNQDEEDLH